MAGVVNLKNNGSIPDSDHVMRYCSPQHVQNGKIAETAFSLRPNEQYMSVNWLEYFNGNTDFPQRLQAIRNSIGLSLKPTGRFVKISVAAAKHKIENLQITYHLLPQDPSHAGIYYPGPDENREYTLELANLVNPDEIFPAVPE